MWNRAFREHCCAYIIIFCAEIEIDAAKKCFSTTFEPIKHMLS